nr:MAG TPA: hypothetical protein [Caudoviricetes sp.]
MKTEVILKVDKLENLVAWIARNFVCGERPTNVRALYMFANKPGTSMEEDGVTGYGKFDDEDETEKYFEALRQSKFIIDSELVDQDVVRDDTTAEVIRVAETWKITVTPSMNNTEDAFVAYCPRPYNPE